MRVLAVTVLVLVVSVATSALPTSLVADAQVAATKAKRVDEEMMFGNQQNKPSASGIFYAPVSKRAVRQEEALPAVFSPTESPATDVEDKQASRRVISHTLSDADLLAHMRRGAMDRDENSKTVRQYEKGYLYGVGKEALDKKAENTLLKSEVYGEPVNEYRYYGGGDAHRSAPKTHSIYSAAEVGARLKRDLEVDPEALLALISLWQSQRAPSYPAYRDRSDFSRYGYERQEDNEGDDNEEVGNGDWLESPVPVPLSRYQYETPQQYPLANHYGMVDNYPNMKGVYYPPLTRVEHKRGQWGGFTGYPPEKRFMVAKRRQLDRFEEPSVWSRLLATQPRDPMPGMTPRRRILL